MELHVSMRKIASLLALVVAVAAGLGCKTKTKAKAPPPLSLFDRLVREVGRGGPVAVVPSPEGVVAASLRGAPNQVIVKGKSSWLQVDDRARVIWFLRATDDGHNGADLWLLDLSASAPVPERVATGFGDEDRIAIRYDESTPGGVAEVLPPEAENNTYVRLSLNEKQPALSLSQGGYDEIFEEQGENNREAFKDVKLVPAIVPRLRELSRRTLHPLSLQPPGDAEVGQRPHIAAVDTSKCEDPEVCGKQQPLGTSLFVRVIVLHECGDFCHVIWQLYDATTKEFIDYETGKRTPSPIKIDYEHVSDLRNVWVSATSDAFVTEGEVYKIGGGLVFKGKGFDGGWLGGQYHLD
jgi:hypothetical protein